jgi:ABC-type siderophore export system fused ATPase/permease subunit
MNKIVIAITHDDHYFHEADHLLFIQNGKLRAFD